MGKILASADAAPALQPPPLQGRVRFLARDFLAFARRPTRRHPRGAGLKAGASAIAVLLGLSALFTLLVCLPILRILHDTIGLVTNPHVETGTYLFSAVAIAPILEELMCRAGLRNPRWSVLGMCAMGLTLCQSQTVTLCTVAVIGAPWLADWMCRRRLSPQALIRLRWKRGRAFLGHYPLVVYCNVILFACAHFSNFIPSAGIGWKNALLVLTVLSQSMNGLVFSYLRLRHGLRYAIAAHFLWNAGAVSVTLLGQ